MTWPRIVIDMDKVRELHAQGWRLKAVAAHLGVRYNTLSERTAAAGIRFRNGTRAHKKGLPRIRPAKRKPDGVPAADSLQREHDRTRRILALYDAREHAPHWEKPLWTQQIQAMQA